MATTSLFKRLNLKRLTLAALALVSLLALPACFKEGGEQYNFDAVVTVPTTVDSSGRYVLRLGANISLAPSNLESSPFDREVRALANFTIATPQIAEGNNVVVLNYMDSIHTKGVSVNYLEDNPLIYGDDPLDVLASWQTSVEDGYLTLLLQYAADATSPILHSLNLVQSTVDPLTFRLFHDAKGEIMGLPSYRSLIAFKLPTEILDNEGFAPITLKWHSQGSGEQDVTFKKAAQ